MPKFRGDSDDWLDDEGPSGKGSGGRQKKPKASMLSPEKANATVAEVFPKLCRVHLDAGSEERRDVLCAYRRSSVLRHSETEGRERSPVAVGDRVLVEEITGDSGVIEGVCARKNALIRPAPGRETGSYRHVIAANVDGLVIVMATREPDFNPGLVDRYLVAASAAKIRPWICVTKIDLLKGEEPRPWEMYRSLSYDVHEVCSKSGQGIDALREELCDRTIVFSGQSGVGKTTLLRSLTSSEIGRVAEISEATGKGKHTTTGAILLGGPGESRWIDTPGVREFGLEVAPKDLRKHFPEFKDAGCNAMNCLHQDEADCRIRDLPEYPRYASYRRMLQSLMAGER